MSTVRPLSNSSAANSDTSTLNEGMPIPSGFIRTEVARMLEREQEKAVALLETSPLLSYLFFTYVVSAKETPDSPVSDHSEELSALKLRSEKFESELAAAQAALTGAHDLVETLREEVQQLRADTLEDHSREAAVLEEKEKEKEDLRREVQAHKSEADTLQKTMAKQQLEIARTNQRHIADKAALQTRLDELQRQFDELSRKQEVATTPMAFAPEESATDRMSQSPEQPSTPTRRSRVPQTLTLMESPTTQRPSTPDVAPPGPPTPQAPPMPSDAQTSDQSSTSVRLTRAQKYKAKRVAKKQAQREAQEAEAHFARVDDTTEAF